MVWWVLQLLHLVVRVMAARGRQLRVEEASGWQLVLQLDGIRAAEVCG